MYPNVILFQSIYSSKLNNNIKWRLKLFIEHHHDNLTETHLKGWHLIQTQTRQTDEKWDTSHKKFKILKKS